MTEAVKTKTKKIYSNLLFSGFAVYSIWLQFIHEPWRDEALAWILGRDHNFLELLAQLRYEGHPFLWMWICGVFAKLGLPYQTQGIFHLLFVLGIAYLICYKLSFSAFFQTLVLIGTPLLYSINAIARTYAPAVFFILLLTYIYAQRYTKHYILYAVSLFCAMQLNVYGFIVASGWFGADVVAMLVSALRGKSAARFKEKFLNRNFLIVFGIYSVSAVFFILVNMTDIFKDFLIIQPAEMIVTAYDVNIANMTFTAESFFEEIHLFAQFFLFHVEDIYGKVIPGAKFSYRELIVITAFYTLLPVLIAGRKSRERFFLGLSGILQMTLLYIFMALTPIGMLERHASVGIFGIVALYALAVKERGKVGEEAGQNQKQRMTFWVERVIIGGAVFGITVCILFSIPYEAKRVWEDRNFLYSSSEEAAKAIISQGYDREDVLITASATVMTSSILPYLKHHDSFLYKEGFRSFPHQQELPDHLELNLDYVSMAEAEFNREAGRYSEALVILLKEEEATIAAYDTLYEKVYDEAGRYFRQEGYVIYKIK